MIWNDNTEKTTGIIREEKIGMSKITYVEIVLCKDCKHRPKEPYGFNIEFPEGSKCPCQCSGDEYYSWYPEDNWFCAYGERKDK